MATMITEECINCGGETVSPAVVEAALCGHPSVKEAMAFAAPHAELHEVVAVAVPMVATVSSAVAAKVPAARW